MTASVADRPVDLRREPSRLRERGRVALERVLDVARRLPPERFATGLERLRAATAAMSDAEWLDPDGFSWAYEDLHGHVRAHHAMIGPWAARVGWPARIDRSAPIATGSTR